MPLECALERLDLDDIGAHVGEILRAGRTLQVMTKAHDAHCDFHGSCSCDYAATGVSQRTMPRRRQIVDVRRRIAELGHDRARLRAERLRNEADRR